VSSPVFQQLAFIPAVLDVSYSTMWFYADSLALTYSNVDAAKQWWIEAFDCKVAKVPEDWDNTLPSDVALKFPRDDEPTILLSAQTEVDQAKFDRPSTVVSTIIHDLLRQAKERTRAAFHAWHPRWADSRRW
jgi:hypothetical protein